MTFTCTHNDRSTIPMYSLSPSSNTGTDWEFGALLKGNFTTVTEERDRQDRQVNVQVTFS